MTARTVPLAQDIRGLDLEDYPRCLAEVRRLTRLALTGVRTADVDDVLLVVTELVCNAFDHGRGPRLLRLRVSPHPCVVRCEVDDTAPELPVLGRSRLGPFRGRGIVLVDRLATAWGTDRGESGKTVWAELDCRPVVSGDTLPAGTAGFPAVRAR
ncbi:ATP-binding protein [Lentzea sp. NPDC060358]|uniref:ATP-binding protein n=1 Tax=Lentzea sp. NPDC060358 TaxID=3347103 RepID=UPI00365D6AF0